MTGIRLPQHPHGVQGCEIGSGSFDAPAIDNLLRTHLIQMNRMQSPKNNEDATYINLNISNEQPMMVNEKTQNVNAIEIVPKSQALEGAVPVAIKEETQLDHHLDEQSTSAHVVDELKRVLEERKKVSEAGTSRDEGDEMEVASSFSEQDKMNIDESIIEQRKQRRRERNRLAAQRCRLKKREQAISVSQEVNQLESANKALRDKIQHLQHERDTLHSLIRKHLPKCVSHPEIETSNMETNVANKAVEGQHKETAETTKETKRTMTTWTMSSPTETVNDVIVEAVDQKSKSSQISPVKHEVIDEAAHREAARKTMVASFTGQPVWPGMVQCPPQLGMNIPYQAVTVPDPGKSYVWSGVGASPATLADHTTQPLSVATSDPANLSIPDLDQPLIIDLSADRFNRTSSQRSEAVKAESSPATEQKIIGHYIIR